MYSRVEMKEGMFFDLLIYPSNYDLTRYLSACGTCLVRWFGVGYHRSDGVDG